MSPYPTEIPERTRRGRFVTLCQQLFALAVVVAVLTPAARTVTMDVRPAQPEGAATATSGARTAEAEVALQSATVPTAEVDPEVTEYPLTAPAGGVHGRVALRGTTAPRSGGGDTVTSGALPVSGYGTVGVTWAHDAAVVPDDAIAVKVRTRTGGGAWSGWTAAEYHDDHGPDPRSAEGKQARPGTDAVLVGDVDQVQVQVTTTKTAPPADMKLAVIDPGTPDATAQEKPAIDTARLAAPGTPAGDVPSTPPATDGGEDGQDGTGGDGDGLELQAAVTTPKPQIYSRAQWGADERLRDKTPPQYYEVRAGFVHHTVNANDYTKSQVPGIIRGIYSYHVRSRGWSDIGYNFLVDRFGRIWEGRAGGVDRPVVGAHTQGYNNYSFAMSAIGNYDIAQPSSAMINAYGALFAWKLSLHGVNAASTSQLVGSKKFKAINGHRDAGSTACPGRYLYAQLGTIRSLAAKAQKGWSGRDMIGNYVGSANPDLLARKTSNGRLMLLDVVRKGTTWRTAGRTKTNIFAPWASQIMRVGDWDRDGRNDIIAIRKSDKVAILFRGRTGATFYSGVALPGSFKGVKMLASVGDVTGDGYPDLMGQPKGDRMRIYPGRGLAGVSPSYPAYSAVTGTQQIGVGLWDTDGAPDSLVRNGSSLVLYRGNGPGGWSSAATISTAAASWDWIVGLGTMPGSTTKLVAVRNKTTKGVYLVPQVGGKLGTPVLVTTRPKFDLAG
ncbi:N-acetylmuramoyl-L-alanine amidase [Pimelobacter simplex]|uniref:N-acetylmuramoyl-L-alanine amidase n=1 Tax=Nocardioides simplex TaxID=2045 RepID=UPI0038245E4F